MPEKVLGITEISVAEEPVFMASEVRTNIWKNPSLVRAAPLAVAVLCVFPQLHQRPLRYLSS